MADARLQLENRLWKAQQGLCSICRAGLLRDEPFHDDKGWNLDHVFPRAHYRLGTRGNILLAHRVCNTAKADRDPTGCEIVLLHAVNAKLGHWLTRDPVPLRERRPSVREAWHRYVTTQAIIARSSTAPQPT